MMLLKKKTSWETEMLNVCHNFEEGRGRKVEVSIDRHTTRPHTSQPGQFELIVIMVIMIVGFS